MKSSLFLLPLILSGTLGCQSSRTAAENDLAENGYILSGGFSGSPHMAPGDPPSDVIAFANWELNRRIREITGDQSSRSFLAPTLSGYDIIILTRDRLSEAQENEMIRYVQVALKEAESVVYRKPWAAQGGDAKAGEPIGDERTQ